jgi:hypothetical protein
LFIPFDPSAASVGAVGVDEAMAMVSRRLWNRDGMVWVRVLEAGRAVYDEARASGKMVVSSHKR